MTTTIVLQQAINGVVLGSLYVLVALGLTLIYGVLVQINFAHADFVTLGAFAAYFFMHLVGGGYILSTACSVPPRAIAGKGSKPASMPSFVAVSTTSTALLNCSAT